MALTDITLRNARPRDKAYKLNDGKGLLCVVNPNGTKYWRCCFAPKTDPGFALNIDPSR
jgi:hypothetical protein